MNSLESCTSKKIEIVIVTDDLQWVKTMMRARPWSPTNLVIFSVAGGLLGLYLQHRGERKDNARADLEAERALLIEKRNRLLNGEDVTKTGDAASEQ